MQYTLYADFGLNIYYLYIVIQFTNIFNLVNLITFNILLINTMSNVIYSSTDLLVCIKVICAFQQFDTRLDKIIVLYYTS
jgi:hypothetical protein